MHSCHTALSNYSTIAAVQVMEFQLKYVSFRICFCREESKGGLCSAGLERGGNGWRGRSCTGDIFRSLCSLSIYHPYFTYRTILYQRNGLFQALYVQMHSAVRVRTKTAVFWQEVFATWCRKWSFLVDRLSPRTITLPAVPNRGLQEINAREGRSVQTGG